jgi:hypothetical protein
MHPSTLRRRRRLAGERQGARGRSKRGGREQRSVGGVGTETSERGRGFVRLQGRRTAWIGRRGRQAYRTTEVSDGPLLRLKKGGWGGCMDRKVSLVPPRSSRGDAQFEAAVDRSGRARPILLRRLCVRVVLVQARKQQSELQVQGTRRFFVDVVNVDTGAEENQGEMARRSVALLSLGFGAFDTHVGSHPLGARIVASRAQCRRWTVGPCHLEHRVRQHLEISAAHPRPSLFLPPAGQGGGKGAWHLPQRRDVLIAAINTIAVRMHGGSAGLGLRRRRAGTVN